MLSLNIIGYLFLGGVGGGTGLAAAVIGFLAFREKGPQAFKDCRSLLSASFAVACALLACACALLVMDLGRPDRLLILFTSPTYTFLFAGTMALGLCLVLDLALALVWNGLLDALKPWTLPLQALAAAASLFVAVYTGLLLGSLGSVPFWNSFWLPVLFLLSSCSCGVATLLQVGQFRGCIVQFPVLFERLLKTDAVLIVLEGLAVAALLYTALHAGGANQTELAAAASAGSLLTGEFARLFWISFVLCGLVIPLVLEVVPERLGRIEHRSPYVLLWTAALVLAGGLFMRLSIVAAGARPALIFGA